jgi:hypothetical protein
MTKWYYIAAAVFFIVMAGSIAVTEYQKGHVQTTSHWRTKGVFTPNKLK